VIIAETARLRSGKAMPSLGRQAANVAGAVGRAVVAAITGQDVFVGEDILARRRATCAACEHLVGAKCVLCGCPYERKIKLATEQCPLNPPKW
jgi:hypothetical protein